MFYEALRFVEIQRTKRRRRNEGGGRREEAMEVVTRWGWLMMVMFFFALATRMCHSTPTRRPGRLVLRRRFQHAKIRGAHTEE